ncbi:hypothetical protein J4436_03520 [Candidatus Woesearchaeota archaeon]|nr:hypothetical protein [Candidatus Woesearchaeota archaeon]
MSKNLKSKIGIWSFIVGLVIAFLISVVKAADTPTWSVLLLAILGAIVGFLNITDAEIKLYLVASIAFLISFQSLATVVETLLLGWQAVSAFFQLMSVFIAPGAAIVAIKALYTISRD